MNIPKHSYIDILIALFIVLLFRPLIGFIETHVLFSISCIVLLEILALMSISLTHTFDSQKLSLHGFIRLFAAFSFIWLLIPLTDTALVIPEWYQMLLFFFIIAGGALAVNADIFLRPNATYKTHLKKVSPWLVGACIIWSETLIFMYTTNGLYPTTGILLFSALSYLPLRLYFSQSTNKKNTSLIHVILAFGVLTFYIFTI